MEHEFGRPAEEVRLMLCEGKERGVAKKCPFSVMHALLESCIELFVRSPSSQQGSQWYSSHPKPVSEALLSWVLVILQHLIM